MGHFLINEKASCYLNIAALATVLSIGLLWKEHIALGLITFVYAIAAHLVDVFFHFFLGDNFNKKQKIALVVSEGILFIAWLVIVYFLLK